MVELNVGNNQHFRFKSQKMVSIFACLYHKQVTLPCPKVASPLGHNTTNNYRRIKPRINQHFAKHGGGSGLAMSTGYGNSALVFSNFAERPKIRLLR